MNQIIIVNNTLDINSLPELKPEEERRIIASKTATIPIQFVLPMVNKDTNAANTSITVLDDFSAASILFAIYETLQVKQDYVLITNMVSVKNVFNTDGKTVLPNGSTIKIHTGTKTKAKKTGQKKEEPVKEETSSVTIEDKPGQENTSPTPIPTKANTTSRRTTKKTKAPSSVNHILEYDKLPADIKEATDNAIQKAKGVNEMLLFHLKLELATFGYLPDECEKLQKDIIANNKNVIE